MPKINLFHGTSSVFLESIEKNGLIPNPKNKYWDDFNKSSEDQPSCVSLPGVYLTNFMETAECAANNAIKKFGGEPIFISCIIDTDTAVADEDHIWPWVEDNIDYILKRYRYSSIVKFKAFYDSLDTFNLNTIHKVFNGRLHYDLKGTEEELLSNSHLLLEIFESSIERRISHVFNLDPRKYYVEYQSEHKLFRVPKPPKNIETAECEYLKVVDQLCYIYKHSCHDIERKGHSLRILEPILFEGINTIKDIKLVKLDQFVQ